jgi:hypothetical protein
MVPALWKRHNTLERITCKRGLDNCYQDKQLRGHIRLQHQRAGALDVNPQPFHLIPEADPADAEKFGSLCTAEIMEAQSFEEFL